MNGPSEMYKLPPVFKLPENIELPNCMYHVRKLQQPAGQVLNQITDQNSTTNVEELQKRWDVVINQLDGLKQQLDSIKSTLKTQSPSSSLFSSLSPLEGAVINVNPAFPPFSLLLLKKLLQDSVSLTFTCHLHSSIKALPDSVSKFFNNEIKESSNSLNILLIFKEGVPTIELVTNVVSQPSIHGEVNILRYLARLGVTQLNYDPTDGLLIDNDAVLDISHRLAFVKTVKEKQSLYRALNAKLGKNLFYGGSAANISDLAVWSVLQQTQVNVITDLTQNMAKWFQRTQLVLDI